MSDFCCDYGSRELKFVLHVPKISLADFIKTLCFFVKLSTALICSLPSIICNAYNYFCVIANRVQCRGCVGSDKIILAHSTKDVLFG